jgi:hypothetical protein
LCADAVRATASHHVQRRHSNRGGAPREDDRRRLRHGHGRLRHRADHLGVRRARRGGAAPSPPSGARADAATIALSPRRAPPARPPCPASPRAARARMSRMRWQGRGGR